MKLKIIINTLIGILGGIMLYLFGGFDLHIQALFFAMCTDFILGIISACIFHSSNKSTTGRLSSNALFKGLVKKCVVLVMVALCYRIDCMLKINILRNGAIIGFIAGELLSIVENMGLIGIPIPKQVKAMIDVLNTKDTDVIKKI